jgi:membrane-associated phospholipid phosphatase
MERLITPTLTTLLQLAYLSYYAIPLALGLLLIWRGRFEEFEEVLFGILLCFYLSYLCYLIVPAIGPRFTLSQYQSTGLQLPPFLAHLRDALNGLEKNKTDAFPSGHTAVSVLTLYYAWEKGEKVLFAVLMPLSMALIISTVYLRYHYVVDVLGGLALTGITIALAPGLALLFKGEPLPWRNR